MNSNTGSPPGRELPLRIPVASPFHFMAQRMMISSSSSHSPCSEGADLGRRRFVGAAVATLATGAAAGRAASAALGDCLDPAGLQGTPAERLSRLATGADAVSEPPPTRRGTPVTGSFAGVIRRVDVPRGEA